MDRIRRRWVPAGGGRRWLALGEGRRWLALGEGRRWLWVGAGLVIVVAVGVWLLWPAADTKPPPRERQYRAFTACLLTDDKGLAGEPARSAWAGMQHASVVHSVKVQYLSVTGPQTSANALAYFNSLALQKCSMIIAAGDAPVGAMAEGKSGFPGIAYVAIGSPDPLPGVTTVDTAGGDGVSARIDAILSDAARSAA